jgi:Predicted membrane protein
VEALVESVLSRKRLDLRSSRVLTFEQVSKNMNRRVRLSGVLLVVGTTQFWAFTLLAEELYKGYNLNYNYISDLGVGPTSFIFNGSVIALGILVLMSGILIGRKSLTTLFVIGGLGMIGVGIFPETTGPPHLISALLAFLFSSLASFPATRMVRGSVRVLFPILGLTSLISLALFVFKVFGTLGPGGVERFIVLPDLIWATSFGSLISGGEVVEA